MQLQANRLTHLRTDNENGLIISTAIVETGSQYSCSARSTLRFNLTGSSSVPPAREASARHVGGLGLGTYRCVAGNRWGNSSVDVRVLRPGRPDPPERVDVTNTSAHSISFRWAPGYNGGRQQFFSLNASEDETCTSTRYARRTIFCAFSIPGLVFVYKYKLSKKCY